VTALHDGSATSLGSNQMTHFLLVGQRELILHEYIDLGTETYIHSAIHCYTTDVIPPRHCRVVGVQKKFKKLIQLRKLKKN
jgi:hypothetical protein